VRAQALATQRSELDVLRPPARLGIGFSADMYRFGVRRAVASGNWPSLGSVW
jgi:hypothetical protein